MSSAVTYTSPEMLPKVAEWHVYGNEQQGRFLTKYPEVEPTYYGVEIAEDIRNNIFSRQLGKKAYELKDHLGNVRVTFSDIKMPTGSGSQPFRVDLLSKSEYYPYGMVIDELSYNLSNNRYGFGGTHEMDNEVKGGVGNHLSFGDFGYDTRVARRFNLDPIDQIFISNYAGFYNNPISIMDPSGYSPSDPGNGGGSNNTTKANDKVSEEVVVTAKREPTAPEGLSVYSQPISGNNNTNNLSNSGQNTGLSTPKTKFVTIACSTTTVTNIPNEPIDKKALIGDLSKVVVKNQQNEIIDVGFYKEILTETTASIINRMGIPGSEKGLTWSFGAQIELTFGKLGGRANFGSVDEYDNKSNGVSISYGAVSGSGTNVKTPVRLLYSTSPLGSSMPVGTEFYTFESIGGGLYGISQSRIKITQHIELFVPKGYNKRIMKVEKTVDEIDVDWLSYSFKVFLGFKYNP